MKPQRFKIGQEVTPTRGRWRGAEREGKFPLKYGSIYTVQSYVDKNNEWYIQLVEFDKDRLIHFFAEKGFEPVITTKELEGLLSEIKITA